MSVLPNRERRHEGPPKGRRGPFTVEDYMSLTESDDERYEVLDGELLMTPSPAPRHQGTSLNLCRVLGDHVEATGAGVLYAAPLDVILGPATVCQPDIVFIRAERRSIIGEKNIQGPPDLVIEILSPSSRKRDALVKRAIYAEAGVAHFWIVDPDERTLEEYVLEGKTFRQGAILDRPEAIFTPAIFPELSIELARIFA